MLDFSDYVRIPFTIEAFEITDDNFEEVALLIGSEIKEKNGKRHIIINRQIVPNGYRAYIGGYVTRMGDNLRYYSEGSFASQFVEMTDGWRAWFDDKESKDEEEETSYPVEAPEGVDETDAILADPEAMEAIAEAEAEADPVVENVFEETTSLPAAPSEPLLDAVVDEPAEVNGPLGFPENQTAPDVAGGDVAITGPHDPELDNSAGGA